MTNSGDPDQLALKKPTDLDLHCLQRQGLSGFCRTRVRVGVKKINIVNENRVKIIISISTISLNMNIKCLHKILQCQ